MARHKDANWTVPESVSTDQALLCVLMDIRDELKENNRRLVAIDALMRCYRIPRALDALHSMGVAARRRKRKPRARKK